MVGLCRLCASLRKMDALISIRDDTSEICKKLRDCFQLSIHMQDALPKALCQECLENLNSSHKFYMKVQDAQETLQTLFPSTNKGEDTTCEALAQTLAAGNVLNNKKRKVSLNEKEENVNDKKIKTAHKESTITRKIINAETTTQNSKHLDSTADKQISGTIDRDQVDVSLETTGNEKYLQDVYKMLGMTKDEMAAENSIVIFENVDERAIEQKEDKSDENQVDECLEESPLEEHHILQDQDVDEDILESLEQEFLAEEEYKDEVADDGKELDIEIKYVQLDSEEEEEEEKEDEPSIMNGEVIKEVVPDRANLPSLTEIQSWKTYVYLCTECEFKGASFLDLRNHAEAEHAIKQIDKLSYKCYDCQKHIPRYNFFLNHIRSKHHPALKLQCDSCDLDFQNYEQLSFHRSVDCSEANDFVNILPCNHCFKSFHSTHGLQNHVKLQHSTAKNKVKYKCLQCDKEFQQKNCLKVHELTHTDTKKYSCGICDSTFANKNGLDLHLYSHIEEKTFKCNICDKSFKTFITLDQHQIIHSDVKPFKCDYCDKKFRKKIEKTSHERIHTGEMPFQCQNCDKRFRFLSALIAHTRSHDGVKPFACEYCEQTFSDSSNRNKHVKRKHPQGEKDENT